MQGKYVECMAFDRHADCDALQRGNMVVLYFALAQAGLNGRPGCLWLYNEAHILLMQTDMRIPSLKDEIELR
eukprot:12422096-Karenia_brevis.AAC.1